MTSKKSSLILQKSNSNNNKGHINQSRQYASDFGGAKQNKGIYRFRKLRIAQGRSGRRRPHEMAPGGKAQELCNFWSLQHPRWLKVQNLQNYQLENKKNIKFCSNKTVHHLPLSKRKKETLTCPNGPVNQIIKLQYKVIN